MESLPAPWENPDPAREARLRVIVGGVVREALRRSAKEGVAVVGGGPEATLLVRWFHLEGIPASLPTPPLVDAARALLAQCGGLPGLAPSPNPPSGRPEFPKTSGGAVPGAAAPPDASPPPLLDDAPAGVLAGWALAWARNLLPVGTETKTLLVLGECRSGAPILPLGDLYASEAALFAGGCTPPGMLGRADLPFLSRLDRALQALLEEGAPWKEASAALPARLRPVLWAAVQPGGKVWNPRILIPKLGSATLGVDLHL